jgi:diadenylate cyclase
MRQPAVSPQPPSGYPRRISNAGESRVDVKELVNAIHIVELSATTRSSAIRELVDALDWGHENVLPDDVVKAIEEREATAQTIVDKGLALPQAMIEWTGDFRLVLGRSQAGVDCLRPVRSCI